MDNFNKWLKGYESTGAFCGPQTLRDSFNTACSLKDKIGCGWRAVGVISGRLNNASRLDENGNNIINLNTINNEKLL